jgi:hypothetical protein
MLIREDTEEVTEHRRPGKRNVTPSGKELTTSETDKIKNLCHKITLNEQRQITTIRRKESELQ